MAKYRKKIEGYPNLYSDSRYPGQFILRKYSALHGGEVETILQAKTLKQACIERDRLLAEFGSGRIVKKSLRKTFGNYFFELLEIMSTKSEKTFIDFETIGRLYLLPAFENVELSRIDARWEWYKAKQRLANPERKLHHDRKHLIRVMRYANKFTPIPGGVPELPLDAVDKVVKTGGVYTPEEVRRLLAASSPKWQLIIELGVIYGMRIGEIIGLKRSDFLGDAISLPSRSVKTREPRIIPLEIETAKKISQLLNAHAGLYVFPHTTNPTLPMRHYGRTWARIKRRAGVLNKTFHDTRHTSVTWALEAGHSPKLVQKTRGMSSQVMDRIYSHAQTDIAKQMGRDLRGKLNLVRGNSGKFSGVKNDHESIH